MSTATEAPSAGQAKAGHPADTRPLWVQRLTRITTSGNFLPEIDGLRFFAIGSVFLGHHGGLVLARVGLTRAQAASDPISRWMLAAMDQSVIGVQLFFVISGFILALPFAEAAFSGTKRPNLTRYFTRRVTRLEPPYVLSLLFCFAFALAITAAHLTREPVTLAKSLPHLGASILYIHNLVYQTASTVNPVAWSLEVEIQFYILAPLLSLLFYVRNAYVRRGVLVAAILVAGIGNDLARGPETWTLLFMSILGQIQYFLAGLLLADVYLCWLRRAEKKHLAWDAVALACGVLLAAVLLGGRPRWCVPGLIFIAYVAGFRGPLFNRLLRMPILYVTGGMCYTLYLYHGTFGAVVPAFSKYLYMHKLPYWVNYPVQLAIAAPIVWGLCAILFLLVERPCMDRDWPAKLWGWVRGKRA